MWSCGYDCIGVVPKETKLSEDHTDNNVIDESQPQELPQSAANTLPTQQTSLPEKAKKKKKTQSKKRSEKNGVGGGSTGDGMSATEFDSASLQLSVVATDESGSVGKRPKRVRNEGQVVRSEDVDGYCGSLPVDDLIEFIDCGRKLWRSRSQPGAESLTETEKLQSVKKESVKDATVENDSGFGDTEVLDRIDGSHSDDTLSPSVSSVSESVEVAELLSDLLLPAANQSTVEANEEKLISTVDEMTASTTSEWTLESEMSFAAAFLSDEELSKPEPEFTVVRQKKRRTKNHKVVPVTDKAGCDLVETQNSSMVCSSASSERSNSPQSISTVGESTVNGSVNRRMSDAVGNTSRNGTSLFRRYNSEPKWRATCPRFRPSPNTSAELHPIRAQTHASTNPSGTRWWTVNGAASAQQRKIDNMKDRKYNSSAEPRQLPDVISSAERPTQADKPGLSLETKVMMQDAHCQTVDDDRSQSTTDQTGATFDLLTLQLFMYHGELKNFCMVFITQCYASVVYAVVVCLSIHLSVCHKPTLYQNG